ncbi:hypothetical protein GS597_19700 [Synechococcales cyanobacterium C]|uniref:Regulator of SigK n=1 Tax=Petrachloros mirabilis ULC683 TaxID=2781853 RepID=A0A8K2AA19_9CYAN|nr:anti-sigma factor [Petrachloros mirabilis]NCJ08690.1 hypothetical protein [Petrachloros mirabilis ULC683]
MTSPRHSEDWQDLIAGYVLDDLSPAETAQMQGLLSQPEIQAEVEALQELVDLLDYTPPEQTLPAHLRAQVLTAAQTLGQEKTQAQPQSQWKRRWWVLGGILVALLATLAFDNLRLRQALEQNQHLVSLLRQPNIQLYTFAGTDVEPEAAASLIIHSDRAQATLVTHRLPQLPAGEVYRLWAILETASDPLYCGQFNRDTAEWNLPTAACSQVPSQLLITAEDADAPPVPAGTLVLQSS